MSDDYFPISDRGRSVEQSGESSSEGGGYRFVFHGGHRPAKKKKDDKKTVIEPPVKLVLSKENLGDELIQVHSEESVAKKVHELDQRIKDGELDDDSDPDAESEQQNEKK